MENRIKIALADRNQLMRESLSEFLNLSGYLVTRQATSKNELLSNKEAGNDPDVCLLQIENQDKEIEETINALRKKYPCKKVIVFSIEMQVNRVNLPKFGADESLPKNSSLNTLRKLIEGLTKETTKTFKNKTLWSRR